MATFLAIMLSFPAVIYTVLLGASLLYWVFVMVGAARLELHGDGADGVGGGHDVGDVGGGHDVGDVGGGHDVGDAGGGHDVGDAGGGHDAGDVGGGHEGGGHDAGGHHDGGDGGDGDGGDADRGGSATAHHGSAFGNLMASLKLRSAPATLVLSVLMLFSWLFCVLGMQTALRLLPASSMPLVRLALLVLPPILGLPFTSLAVRPLARVFAPPKSTGHQDLVGQTCTIRTGVVTDRFGEALLEDGGAGLVVHVRVDAGEKLKRGDTAIIVAYDEKTQEFLVAPMDEDAGPSRRGRG